MKCNPKYNGRYVEGAGGVRLFVEENGNPKNPTILWIHGYCQCRLSGTTSPPASIGPTETQVHYFGPNGLTKGAWPVAASARLPITQMPKGFRLTDATGMPILRHTARQLDNYPAALRYIPPARHCTCILARSAFRTHPYLHIHNHILYSIITCQDRKNIPVVPSPRKDARPQ